MSDRIISRAVVELEKDIVQLFEDAGEVIGLRRSIGGIYGIIFASPTPLSFRSIEARLHISKGSVSQGLTFLRKMGAVTEVTDPSDRAKRFVADLELRALVTGFLRTKVQPRLAGGISRLLDLKAKADAVNLLPYGELRIIRERLEKLGSWQNKGATLIPLITKFIG